MDLQFPMFKKVGGGEIHVNPFQVRVIQAVQGGTWIHFDDKHMVAVDEPLHVVAERLAGR
jgi:hypothetical protein